MQARLFERDQKVIWHPYTQHALIREALPVKSATGSRIILEDGNSVIDGISSWWVNLHRHSHPIIAEAISEQARKLEHVIFAGFTHKPAVLLAELLIEGANRVGGGFSRVFFRTTARPPLNAR